MHNLGTVLRFELTRTLKKPTFWISILAFPLLIGLIMGLAYFSGKSSDDAEKAQASAKFSFIVMDETKIIPDEVITSLGASRIDNIQQGIDKVVSGSVDAFIFYPSDLSNQKIQIYNKNSGLVENGKYAAVAEQLMKASVTATMSPQYIAILTGKVNVEQKSYENGREVNLLGQAAIPALFLVIFYLVIVLLGNQMLTSTTEEKENRVTEMILTSIKSRPLIIGKIIALIILGLVQIFALLIPFIIAYVFAREALNIPDISQYIAMIEIDPVRIAIGIGLLISSFMLFTGILVGIGAAMPTAKEANSFFGFTILAMFVPLYAIMAIVSQPQLLIVQIFSYFPLTAPITLMVRNAVGNLTVAEGIIGVIVLSVMGVIAMTIAIRIFRYGTLEYSKRISLKSVLSRKKRA